MNKNGSFKLLDSKSGKYFFSQTAFGTAFTCLTSGVFLSGLALLMGASDVVVSYISVITTICGVLILVLAPFLERFRSRKKRYGNKNDALCQPSYSLCICHFWDPAITNRLLAFTKEYSIPEFNV